MLDLTVDLTRAGDVDWVSTAATAYQGSLEGLRTQIEGLGGVLEDLDGELARLTKVQEEVGRLHARLDAADDATGQPRL